MINPTSLNNQNGHYDILSQHTLCSKRTLKWQIQTDLSPVESPPQWQLHIASLDLQH